jgi:hypothetical protein
MPVTLTEALHHPCGLSHQILVAGTGNNLTPLGFCQRLTPPLAEVTQANVAVTTLSS